MGLKLNAEGLRHDIQMEYVKKLTVNEKNYDLNWVVLLGIIVF